MQTIMDVMQKFVDYSEQISLDLGYPCWKICILTIIIIGLPDSLVRNN